MYDEDGAGEEPQKRARTEFGAAPGGGGGSPNSRVIFIRGLSYDSRPEDIVPHFVSFGAIKMLHLGHKQQAFVEFPTIEQAQQAVDHANATNLAIAGRQVRCSKSYTPDGLDHNRGAVLLIGANGVITNLEEMTTQLAGPPSVVVVLNIFNSAQTPVTLDAVHSLTSYIGPVSRILLFDKDVRTNAMVEFGNLETAIKAQKMLHRHHLWNNQTGLILTNFSKQTSLNIAGYLAKNPSNFGRARDYTVQGGGQVQINPNFPTGTVSGNTPYAMAQQQQQPPAPQSYGAPPAAPTSAYSVQPSSSGGYPGAQPAASSSGGYPGAQPAASSSTAYGAYAGQPSSSASYSGGQTSGYGAQTNYGAPPSSDGSRPASSQYGAQSSSPYGTTYSTGQQGSTYSSGLPSQPPPPQQQQQQQQQQQHYGQPAQQYGQAVYAPTSSAQYGGGGGQYGGGGGAQYNPGGGGGFPDSRPQGNSQLVLMVAGVDKSLDGLTQLFNLCGFFGNVVRVKFMYKKDNIAMVEFQTPEEAQSCLKLFKGVEVFGKPVNAKQASAQFSTLQIQSHEQFSRDFSHEKKGRYMKGIHSPNYRQVCQPSSKLHVANLQGYTEEHIRQLFSQYGRVDNFSFCADPSMGFVQMATIGEACTALACLHNYPNPHGPQGSTRPLRVSFTSRV
jgi:RNA recognition motif-containing protein